MADEPAGESRINWATNCGHRILTNSSGEGTLNRIGIRHEDKSEWERRSPLVPDDVARLVREHGVGVTVQSSSRRAFGDDLYRAAGAHVSPDLSDCSVIMGVKEIPVPLLEADKAHVIFSHTIKGQPAGIPVLRRLTEVRGTLIDYEKIVDAQNRRLVFFGRWAGIAGTIDSLWALGRRLQHEGFETPFLSIRPAHRYQDFAEIKREITAVGDKIRQDGLPEKLTPFICGFTGHGHVAQGAQEIFDLLPVRSIAPSEVATANIGGHEIGKVVFETEHLFVRQYSTTFDREDYRKQPEQYESRFEPYLPHLTMVMNCIYWDPRYPRIITRDMFRELYANTRQPRLRMIGDISCDIGGSMECNVRYTTPSNPIYVYDPETGLAESGVAGRGPVVLAIDALPCEIPVDASMDFSRALFKFIPDLARADFSRPLAQSGLPPELQAATIVYQGQFTPSFEYLSRYL